MQFPIERSIHLHALTTKSPSYEHCHKCQALGLCVMDLLIIDLGDRSCRPQVNLPTG